MSHSPFSVQVEPRYLADQSSPKDNVYTFSYTITVTNVGTVGAQLIARHWLINDASGHAQEVKGLGVIGQQPLLAPGESFRYTSGCRLQAASGTMHGSFFVVTEEGERFDVPVPMFVLEADIGGAPVSRVLH
ncbi:MULTISPECIES: Co2+/Mg2+ efflux protein ApaG [Variovorax]|uniref:Protein ApaG n=1 Tax=Variovorax boronicumulans TaxID=436515 RepID=A0A1E7TWE2_9BURK|nr:MULTISPECIES: Co2+/Mg2+ efflux protein ApaG [Variovorax]ATA52281.1 Co2+/Mg2+ efflux protein ApaG [Variovorax boronicumulans]MDP9918864.1 ApaG protein [Variovorax boronicumulans]MDP9922247.1 ApaG protein [Variovorax boronicumulans]OEZ27930.1 protein ApaG [Variovorax boronicumulans]TSD57217.1 Co2+/Mg2+ efflux protein ApaG [Variovorax sp. KBS0712]